MEMKVGDKVKLIGSKHLKLASYGYIKRIKKTFIDIELQIYLKSKEKGDTCDEIEKREVQIHRKNLQVVPESVIVMPTSDQLAFVDVLPENELKEVVTEVVDNGLQLNGGGEEDDDWDDALTFEEMDNGMKSAIDKVNDMKKEIIQYQEQVKVLKDTILGMENQMNYYKSISNADKSNLQKDDILKVVNILSGMLV
tara:strand:+ start:105 stop:692 length:588 start_codon:yes stop_codon:yes gene_type:complete